MELDFATAAEMLKLGLPTLLLLLLCFGLWKSARWIGEQVLRPVVAAHLEFLRTMKAALGRQTTILERMEQRLSIHDNGRARQE